MQEKKEGRAITLNGTPIIIRELTVAEVEAVLDALLENEPDIIETILPESPVPAPAIALSAGRTIDELKQLPCSELRFVIEEVQEINPFLIMMLERLARIGRQLIETENEEEQATGEETKQSIWNPFEKPTEKSKEELSNSSAETSALTPAL